MTFSEQLIAGIILLIVGFFCKDFFQWITAKAKNRAELHQTTENRLINAVDNYEKLFASLISKNEQIELLYAQLKAEKKTNSKQTDEIEVLKSQCLFHKGEAQKFKQIAENHRGVID